MKCEGRDWEICPSVYQMLVEQLELNRGNILTGSDHVYLMAAELRWFLEMVLRNRLGNLLHQCYLNCCLTKRQNHPNLHIGYKQGHIALAEPGLKPRSANSRERFLRWSLKSLHLTEAAKRISVSFKALFVINT